MLIVEKKTPKTSAVDEVRRLWQKERDLDAELLELAKKIDVLDQAAREAMKQNQTPRQALEAKQRAELDAETARYAIQHVRELRREAIPASWKERGAKLRADADDLDRQAAELDMQAAPHLAALEQIMGTPYIPRVRFEQLAEQHGAYVQHRSPQPRIDQLHAEAAMVRERASHEDARRFGLQRTHARTVDELIGQATRDPFDYAP